MLPQSHCVHCRPSSGSPRKKNAQLCGRKAFFPGKQIRTGLESLYLTGGRAVYFLNSNQLLCTLISYFLGEMVGWVLPDMSMCKPEQNEETLVTSTKL